MPLKSTKNTGKDRLTFSMRYLFVLLFLVMCTAAAGLIFNHWHTSIKKARSHIEAIQNLQNQQILKLVEEQFDQISIHISTVFTLLASDTDLINNERSIRQILMTLMVSSPQLATLSFADEQNNYYSVFRPENDDQVMYARAKEDGVMISGKLSFWQNSPQDLQVNTDFYANQRPWYRQAIEQKQSHISWTPVYTYHSSGSAAIGASQAKTFSDGKKGVVAADYLLNGLAMLLSEIADQQTTVLLLFDHKKNTIANNVNGASAKQNKLLLELNNRLPMIHNWLDNGLATHWQMGDLLLTKQLINKQSDTHYWLINVTSEKIKMAEVNQQAQTYIWISIIILLLAVLLFNLLARLLLRPIEQLEKVSKEISKGKWAGKVTISRIKEINNLALAYQFMAKELRSTLDNLESKVIKRTLGLRKLNQQLEKSNITDPLTQIPNRRFFNQQMEHWFGGNTLIFVALVDIDHFKKFNDNHGHLAGDQALIMTASVINKLAGHEMKVARIGGEEFAIIYVGTKHKKFIRKIAQMQKQIIKKVLVMSKNGKVESLTVSIGVAKRQIGEDDWNEVYGRADRALYQAKNDGRNCLVDFSEKLR